MFFHRTLAIAALSFWATISAQTTVTITSNVYEPCSQSVTGTDTITSTIVQTVCPLCTDMSETSTAMDGQITHTTVFTTVLSTVCSTGLAPATYTITDYCTGATPSYGSGPGYVPPGFTTTVMMCTACGTNGQLVTMTVPSSNRMAGAGPTPANNVGGSTSTQMGCAVNDTSCSTTSTKPAGFSGPMSQPYSGAGMLTANVLGFVGMLGFAVVCVAL